MSKLAIATLGLAALAGATRAQTINVDFQSTGTPFGSPAAGYGGAASSPGFWNAVSTASATNLVAWNGAPTSVGISTNGTPPNAFGWHNDVNTSGDDEALIDDFHRPDEYLVTWTFTGLAPGEYDVFTIGVSPFNSLWVIVSVTGSPDPATNLYEAWNGSYSEGANYVRHHKTVTDGTVQISMQVIGIADYAYFNGIQLVKTDAIGTPMCFGDGSIVACPCANNGASGHGCENSVGTGGALIAATGTLSPDTAVLHSTGELPSVLSIFLQGNAVVGPVPFGDGLRCAGGILKRLYVKAASGGAVSAPAIGDLSITAQSASLGDTIPAGERRYYQVYYRDPDAFFCPSPSGGTFNATNAVKLVW